MYLGLIAFNRAMDDPSRAARVSAVMILIGFVNIPIIKFSVDWFNTLHQPASVVRMGGPAVDSEFLRPLLVMALAFTMLFFTLHMIAMRTEIWRRRVAAMRASPPVRQPPVRRAERMELAHNEGYVLASYLITLVAMIVIIGWVLLDSRGRQRELKRLEEAGIRRRSAPGDRRRARNRKDNRRMTEQQTEEPVRPKLSRIGVIIAFLPIVTFLALAGIFWKQLTAGGNPARCPPR